jgi:colicin import membrane protein
MAAVGQDTCAFPGCTRPRVPAPSGGGRPAAYCDDTGHTAVTAFRARRAATGAATATDKGDDVAARPASLAGMRLRSVADQVGEELAGHRRRLDALVEAALESFDVLRRGG